MQLGRGYITLTNRSKAVEEGNTYVHQEGGEQVALLELNLASSFHVVVGCWNRPRRYCSKQYDFYQYQNFCSTTILLGSCLALNT
jgi:hypothetical protein